MFRSRKGLNECENNKENVSQKPKRLDPNNFGSHFLSLQIPELLYNAEQPYTNYSQQSGKELILLVFLFGGNRQKMLSLS